MHTSRRAGRVTRLVAASLAVSVTAGCHRDPNVQKRKYLESGIRYETEGKNQEAIIQFSNALKVDHNYADAHYELAKTYIRMGTTIGGYQELLRTVDLSPNNLKARIDLGSILLAGGLPDKAQEQANAVLAIDSHDPDAYGLMAGIAARRGDRAEALKNIQQALTLDPNRGSFHTQLAMIEGSDPQGGAAQAESELRRSVALDSSDPTSYMMLASVLEKKGDKAGAIEQYNSAIKTAPANLQARAGLAGLYLRTNDKDKAVQTLRQTAEDLPDDAEGATMLENYYLHTNQPEAALSSYADLTGKYPKSFPIKLAYARLLGANHDFAKAQGVIDELNKVHAKDPQVQELSATLLANAGKVNEAYSLLQAGVKASPNDAGLQMAMGRVAAMKGDMSLAQTSFGEAVRLQPRNMAAQQSLAEVATRRGDMNLLGQVADHTIETTPGYPNAYLWRGSVEANAKDYNKAEGDFQTALKLDASNVQALIELGQLRLMQQHGPEGVALLEQALSKDPNSAKALQLLVQYSLLDKQPEKAVARVQQQIAKAPQNGTFYETLAFLQLTATKDLAGARQSAEKAVQLDPNSRRAVQLDTQALSSSGSPDQAIQLWEQWLGKHPNDPQAYTQLAVLAEAKGDPNKAMEDYKKALQIEPGEPMASNNLAYLMVQNGQNVDVALSLAQAARQGMPNSPNTADTLAWVYYYKGTYQTGRSLLEDALRTDPNNVSMHYHLGMIYTKLGDKPNAELHLKKAASLGPATPAGKDAATALSTLG